MSDKFEALSRLNFEQWMAGDYSPDRSPEATSAGEDAFKSMMWHIYSSAQLPLLAALEEKDQEMNKTKDHLQDVERVRDAFAAEAHHLSAIAKQLPSAERRVGELLLRAEAAEQRLQQPVIPLLGSTEVNDAAWKLHELMIKLGPLNGHQFNALKGCFYEALKVCFKVEVV